MISARTQVGEGRGFKEGTVSGHAVDLALGTIENQQSQAHTSRLDYSFMGRRVEERVVREARTWFSTFWYRDMLGLMLRARSSIVSCTAELISLLHTTYEPAPTRSSVSQVRHPRPFSDAPSPTPSHQKISPSAPLSKRSVDCGSRGRTGPTWRSVRRQLLMCSEKAACHTPPTGEAPKAVAFTRVVCQVVNQCVLHDCVGPVLSLDS